MISRLKRSPSKLSSNLSSMPPNSLQYTSPPSKRPVNVPNQLRYAQQTQANEHGQRVFPSSIMSPVLLAKTRSNRDMCMNLVHLLREHCIRFLVGKENLLHRMRSLLEVSSVLVRVGWDEELCNDENVRCWSDLMM